MKSDWKDYFTFSEKELKAVVVVGAFILLSTAMAIMFPAKKKIVHLFYFDPNTLDSVASIQLGFLPKHYTTLSHFRKKGGKFYQPKDIFKWYGVKQALLEQVYPYVRIKKMAKPPYNQRTKMSKAPLLDINQAKASDLEQLRGIYPALAVRIIKYKVFLGGFSSLGQLKKVYGMSEPIYQQILPYLSLKRGVKIKIHWATMNYSQIAHLGIFEEREIWKILNKRKGQGVVLNWADVVAQFDLSREQALILKERTDIR